MPQRVAAVVPGLQILCRRQPRDGADGVLRHALRGGDGLRPPVRTPLPGKVYVLQDSSNASNQGETLICATISILYTMVTEFSYSLSTTNLCYKL